MKTRVLILSCLALLMTTSLPSIVVADGETLPPWQREIASGRHQATITVGDTPVRVDLAITPFEQSLGLGYRDGLDRDTGMLFVSRESRNQTFWMKGMRFCLDIIWIENGEITGAAESVCPDRSGKPDAARARYRSEMPVTYVLEMPAGWLREHGYEAGTPVDLSQLPGSFQN